MSSEEFDPERTARFLLQARRDRTRLGRLAPGLAPRNEAEGAAAQRALARLLGADPPAGFKIGATGRRMQEYLGLPGPAAGFIEAANVHESDAVVTIPDYAGIGVECEIAVRLGSDIEPGPCTPQQAASAIGAVMAGIEIVQNRYGDLAELGTPALIADQVFHSAAVVGRGVKLDGPDLSRLVGRITIDGELRGEGIGADLLGDPLNCLAWLAASPVAAAFGGLRAGQVVMLGSVTPPVWLDGPAEGIVSFPPLEEVRVRLR
jgi:2-keto-4-pentenoate hydratase